jgi:hypothetical protein
MSRPFGYRYAEWRVANFISLSYKNAQGLWSLYTRFAVKWEQVRQNKKRAPITSSETIVS